jgi:hypothetical protein
MMDAAERYIKRGVISDIIDRSPNYFFGFIVFSHMPEGLRPPEQRPN